MVTTAHGRTFDWRPRHDPRSRQYGIRAVVANDPARIQWRPGPVLDQGREGACVGFSVVAEALATPVRVDLTRVARLTPPRWSRDPRALAAQVYRAAQRIDEWPGEGYEGTSVNAGMKVLRDLGLARQWRWAFGVDDVPRALLRGPVVIGIPWRDGMYDAPDGRARVTGQVVGGHALLVTGYDVAGKWGLSGPAFTWRNSWGPGYGRGGDAVISRADLGALLADGGEACVLTSRSYGR